MRNQKQLSSIMITLLCFWSSVVFALDPMGPPAGRLKQGQFGAEADYSFSNMDLSADGQSIDKLRNLSTGEITIPGNGVHEHDFKIKGLDVHKVYANLGYGITNGCDIFLRLGGTNTEWNSVSDKGFAIGFGARMTFYEDDKWKFGALAQFSWMKSEYDSALLHIPGYGSGEFEEKWTGNLSINEMQIAIGPTYKLTESISVYGGPFLHYVDGDLELKSDEKLAITSPGPGGPSFNGFHENSYDIDEVSEFGGYVGVEINMAESISYNIEYQHTAAVDALGMSLLFRF